MLIVAYNPWSSTTGAPVWSVQWTVWCKSYTVDVKVSCTVDVEVYWPSRSYTVDVKVNWPSGSDHAILGVPLIGREASSLCSVPRCGLFSGIAQPTEVVIALKYDPLYTMKFDRGFGRRVVVHCGGEHGIRHRVLVKAELVKLRCMNDLFRTSIHRVWFPNFMYSYH